MTWLLLACRPDPVEPPGAETGSDTDPAVTTDSAAPPTETTDSGAPAPTALVHAVGRFDDGSPPLASWTLTSHHAVLAGDTLAVDLTGAAGVWYEIEVDGSSAGRFVTTGGEVTYPLFDGIGGTEHRVGLFRRNEGFFGDVGFVGFVPGPGAALVESPVPYAHLIEFVGDSITAGYGDEGADQYCAFSGDTENGYASYAAIAARDLDAGAVVVAYSGKGVVQNYGGDRTEPMPVLYPRALTNDPGSTWDFTGYTPDAVVVNLGTNDFSAPIDPTEFVAGYVGLLAQIRGFYPSAAIFAVGWDGWDDVIPSAIADFGDPNVHPVVFGYATGEGWGCDWHPSLVTHDRLGHELAAEIRRTLGW